MKYSHPIYLVAARRSPIGRFGGGLKSLSPADLALRVAAAIVPAPLKPTNIHERTRLPKSSRDSNPPSGPMEPSRPTTPPALTTARRSCSCRTKPR